MEHDHPYNFHLMITFRHMSRPLPREIARSVVDLDRLNMSHIFAALGVDFPEERRLHGLDREGASMIAAFAQESLVGYLSWGPDFSNPANIYVDAVQIHPHWREQGIFPRLCAEAIRSQSHDSDDIFIRTDVQRTNSRMLRRLLRFGFLPDGVETKGTQTMHTCLGSLAARLERLQMRFKD